MIEFIKYNKSAFTLIEITIALLILAVGLVGILALFPVGFDASVRAANITKATFLAQELIEDLKREGYDDGDGDPTTKTTIQEILVSGNYQSGAFVSPYDYYEFEIDASNIIDGSLCEVTVGVYWPADTGGPVYDNEGVLTGEDRTSQRNVELKTYIAKYEP